MNIARNIREKRKELGFTQEQLADYLKISASAVNKWERGGTYPDITLLPALARLLKTDLNTLLSFREELTEPEINLFLNSMEDLIRENGYQAAFDACMEKIRDFPNCDALILNAALYLDGAILLYGVSDSAPYKTEIEKLYLRLCSSETEAIRNQAIQMMISLYTNREEYEKAEKLLSELPPASEKKEALLITMKLRQGKLEEASGLLEPRLLKYAAELQSTLMSMMEIALREERTEDAERLARLCTLTARNFGVLSYAAYVAQYELAVRAQDAEACMELLNKMLPDMKADKMINCPSLYRTPRQTRLASMVLPGFLEELRTDPRLAFLRARPYFEALLAPYDAPAQS